MNRTPSPSTVAAYRRRIVLLGGVLPLLAIAAATGVMIAWLDRLPHTVAVHWDADGADRFASPWLLILLPVGLGVTFSCISVSVSWRPRDTGRPSWVQKVLLATLGAVPATLAIVFLVILAAQREDAPAGPDPLLAALAGIAFGAVLWLAIWMLLPPADTTRFVGTTAVPIPIPPTAAVHWSQTVALAPEAWVMLAAGMVGGAIAIVATAVAAPSAVGLAVSVTAAIGLLALATGFWRVRADRRGLAVRGLLGWPSVRVAASDIRSVRLVEVDPTADFGGWGLRSAAGGSTGVVLRRGAAIEVTRTSGRVLVVTVDDAATGAGVLAAVAGSPVP